MALQQCRRRHSESFKDYARALNKLAAKSYPQVSDATLPAMGIDLFIASLDSQSQLGSLCVRQVPCHARNSCRICVRIGLIKCSG